MKVQEKFIIIFLFFIWFILSSNYVLTSVASLSVLSVNQENLSIKKIASRQLIKGEKVLFSFKAVDNYLGIITIHFTNSSEPINDKIYFRLREKGNKSWYYNTLYDARQFYHINPYPFGFPIINNSKGKIYEVQLESLQGIGDNIVQIENHLPVVATRYKYPKENILDNVHKFFIFFAKKTYYAFKDGTLFFSSLIYLLPLLLYLSLRFITKRYFNQLVISIPHKPKNIDITVGQLADSLLFVILFTISLLIITDILFALETTDLIIIMVIILWVIMAINFKFVKKYTGIVCLMFFFLSVVFSLLKLTDYSQKIGIWTFVFFFTTVLQEFVAR